MVNNTEFDKFFDDLKDGLKQLIDRTVDEKLEPIRALLLKEATPEPQIGDLVDALEIAELMGFDISTPAKQKIARQKVYYLARTSAIPSVRISRRRVKFDIDKVKQVIASGGVPQPLQGNGRAELASSLQQ